MKKLISLAFSILLVLSLISCNAGNAENTNGEDTPDVTPVEVPQFEYATLDASLDARISNVSISDVLDIDTTNIVASTTGGSNTWGGFMGRGARMSDGTLYSHVNFTSPSQGNAEEENYLKQFYIYKFDGKKWSRAAGPFPTGRDAVSMLKDPSADKVYIVAWPEMHPTIMEFDPKDLKNPKTYDMYYTMEGEEQGWGTHVTNYAASGISPDGYIWVMSTQGAKTWETKLIHHSVFNTNDKTWTKKKALEVETRHCYLGVIPEENGVMTFTGTEDVIWNVIGMKKPKDGNDYVMAAIRRWKTEDFGETFNMVTVHNEPQTEEFLNLNVGNFSQGDYVLGTDGTYNVLYFVKGASMQGNKGIIHAVTDDSGVTEAKRLPFSDVTEGNEVCVRMVYDDAGAAYYITYQKNSSEIKVYAVDTENGIRYSNPVSFDLGEDNKVKDTGLWLYNERSGNKMESYIDITYPAGKDGQEVKYFRINIK